MDCDGYEIDVDCDDNDPLFALDIDGNGVCDGLCVGDFVITNDQELQGITHCEVIQGSLSIEHSNLENIDDLHRLEGIRGTFQLSSNEYLRDVDGLQSLTFVEGDMIIEFNYALNNLDGLQNLTYIGNIPNLTDNDFISSLDSSTSLLYLGDDLEILAMTHYKMWMVLPI